LPTQEIGRLWKIKLKEIDAWVQIGAIEAGMEEQEE